MIQLKHGSYYRQRIGDIAGPMKQRSDGSFVWGGLDYHKDGSKWSDQESELDLIAEVFISDAPPVVCPELKAGCCYETVKPDGSAGPVVKLMPSPDQIGETYLGSELTVLLPFVANTEPADLKRSWWVDTNGNMVRFFQRSETFRIVREHKPPTLAERLEEWGKYSRDWHKWNVGLEGDFGKILADVRALEGREVIQGAIEILKGKASGN